MRGGEREEIEGRAGTRFHYLLGQSKEVKSYPGVTTSNGKLSRAEM